MPTAVNRQIMLVEKPAGKLTLQNFRMAEAAIPKPKVGEVLVRVLYISLDAANRAWMQGVTYREAVDQNAVMAGGTIAEVVESKVPGFFAGDLVLGDAGWQDFAVVNAEGLVKLPRAEPITHYLSVYGIAGLTAYFGLLNVGKPKPGDTVVVSAAAGSVGAFAGQIAKLKGCRVIGIAGSREKCNWLLSELGFDTAINYKEEPLFKSLKVAAPNGINVYFDNVGGDIFEACLPQMSKYGRIVCCGAVSAYDGVPPTTGPRGVPGLIVIKRLTVQGFIFTDFIAEREAALAELRSWVNAGKLRVREEIINGLENTPDGLIGLLAGENRGKRLIKVSIPKA